MLGLANPTHLIFLLAILLLVFGAKRLPEIGSSLGAGLRGFKDSVSGEAAHAAQLHQSHAPVAVPAPIAAPQPVVEQAAVQAPAVHPAAIQAAPVHPAEIQAAIVQEPRL